MLVKIRFDVDNEFFEELKRDVGFPDGLSKIENNIVRVTLMREPRKLRPIDMVFVVAGYMCRGTLIEGKFYVGDLFGNDKLPENKAVEKNSKAIVDAVEKVIASYGLEVRHGVFEVI